MTICVVCDVLGKENNGTTIAAMNLIRALRKRGHCVRVICPDEERRGEQDCYVVSPLWLGPLNGYVRRNGVVIAGRGRAVLEQAMQGAEHVHIMMPFLLGTQALRTARKLGLTVSAGFHCQAENFTSHIFLKDSALANRITYRFFYRHLYRYVDGVHFPTEFIRETFTKYGGPTRSYVISNGVGDAFVPGEPRSRVLPEGKRVILFTGRYSKEKSHGLLIDAAAKSRHAAELQLVFAGSGPLQKKLERRSKKLPNPPIFRFFSREDLVSVIRQAELYVHPAEIEIEAISCLEAISCGLVPVINNSPRSATRFFALDENNLFACNDTDDLARKIDYWLDHPAEKARRSREYAGYTRQFSHEACMDQMEQMILELHREGAGR